MLLQGIQNYSEHEKGNGVNTVVAGTMYRTASTWTTSYSYIQHPHANREHRNLRNYKTFQTEQEK